MMSYSTKRYLQKSYGFLPIAQDTGKNIGKNISKIQSGKYGQELLDHAKQSVTDAFKTASKRAIQKIAEATSHLIGNKTANRNANVLKQINSKIIQRQLQMNMIKKYLKKDIRLQKKDGKY